MVHLSNRTSIDLAYGLTAALDAYFERLSSVACVTIVDELIRSLAHFYDFAAAFDGLSEFRATCQHHPLHRLVLEDPFTERAFNKPHGYAGDGAMLDYIFRPRHLSLTEIGEATHFVTTGVGTGQSIAGRRDHLAKAIAQTVRRARKPRILSVGSGHLRELDTAKRLINHRDFQLVALDWDRASLQEAVNANPDFNIVPLEQPLSHPIEGQGDAGYDLIYSAGAFDNLPAKPASSLLRRLVDMLAPSGRLLVANYASENYARGYMEGMMGWSVRYRNESELERLADSSKLTRFRTHRDAPGNIVYLEVSARTD